MGTTYSIKIVPQAGLDLAEMGKAVQDELAEVNQQMSTYIPDSELSTFNRSVTPDHWVEVSQATKDVIKLASTISHKTAGAFDVTVGPLVDLWGFGPDGRPEKWPTEQKIAETQRAVGYELLEIQDTPPAIRKQHPDLRVDLSAIAKGHGVDRVAETLMQNGVGDCFIEVGGEIRVLGTRQDGGLWRVGIQDPTSESITPMLVLEMTDAALATSGNYRNFYELDGERVSHTIDSRSGRPVMDTIISASVVADNCAMADAIATSMMCLGCDEGLAVANHEGWSVLLMSQELPGEPIQLIGSAAFHEQFPEVRDLLTLSSESSK